MNSKIRILIHLRRKRYIILVQINILVSEVEMQTCPSCGELVPIEYVTCVWCGYDLTGEHIRRAGIKIGRKDAFRRMYRVMRDPFNTMKEISLIPDTKGVRWTIYFIGVALTFHMLVILRKIKGLAFNEQDFVTQSSIISNIINFLISRLPTLVFLIFWPFLFVIVFTVILRFAARIINTFNKALGGGYDKQKVRVILGYSLVPVLAGYVVTIIFRLFTPSQEITSLSYEAIAAIITTMAESGIGLFIKYVQLLFWLWGMVLAVYGMSKAANLSIAETAITTGIPYLMFILLVAT